MQLSLVVFLLFLCLVIGFFTLIIILAILWGIRTTMTLQGIVVLV